jgi:twitching motility protein PilT
MVLDNFISKAVTQHSSDIHLVIGHAPFYRINGVMCSLDDIRLSPDALEKIMTLLLSDYQRKVLSDIGDVDVAYQSADHRTRINVFRDHHGYSMAVRIISSQIPSMEDLFLPGALKEQIEKEHGLILLCGPTGSGKTTTLAAMINTINRKKSAHIITIEDPIEYMYQETDSSIVSQREVGTHTKSFSAGLKAALREDPNVILVGELRDQETIQMALMAAETGQLVFATLHSANVIESVDRLLQYFPTGHQAQIAYQLANSFEAIVSQKLLPRKKGGRVAAFEVLLKTPATANLIRDNRTFQLRDYMTAKYGMQTMEEAIKGLQARFLI